MSQGLDDCLVSCSHDGHSRTETASLVIVCGSTSSCTIDRMIGCGWSGCRTACRPDQPHPITHDPADLPDAAHPITASLGVRRIRSTFRRASRIGAPLPNAISVPADTDRLRAYSCRPTFVSWVEARRSPGRLGRRRLRPDDGLADAGASGRASRRPAIRSGANTGAGEPGAADSQRDRADARRVPGQPGPGIRVKVPRSQATHGPAATWHRIRTRGHWVRDGKVASLIDEVTKLGTAAKSTPEPADDGRPTKMMRRGVQPPHGRALDVLSHDGPADG
ncbi:hypothetical protein SAMN05421812_13718 [Asanoa hainanensis]|uniref:Uncharacterized protein n=1 Tax=Asanoa hainanensis TaxID=560556 RepID=A0A239PGK0_9ACTN|nr:hypothetical protein SAMN05421812_13718 [Asanoa hainanensis]